MPQLRETEISSLLLALLVVPLVSFVVVMKWKATAVRKAEIRKLLAMAAEEACKAEAYAAAEYTDFIRTFNRDRQCAVCFSATTSRCSKCKAVRYCSGKCQIIHWRQGHKKECQPPDIYNSSTTMSCVLSPRGDANSTALFGTLGLRSFDPDLEEPRDRASTIQKLDLYGSKYYEISAAELTCVLKRGSEVISDISNPEIVDVIDSVPFAVISNIVPKVPDSSMHLSTSIAIPDAPAKDAPINDTPDCENNMVDGSISHGVFLPNDLRSGVPRSREVNTHHPEIPVSDILTSTNSIDVIHHGKANTLNLPASKNHTCALPVSRNPLDNPAVLRSSEHEVHSSASFTHNLSSSSNHMASLLVSNGPGKSPPNAKNPVYDLPTSKGPLQHSYSTKNQILDSSLSKASMPNIASDISWMDAPSSRSSADEIHSTRNSGSSSSCLQTLVSSGSSSSSLIICDGSSNSTCSTTSIFQSSMPIELNVTRPVSEIGTLGTSVLSTTGRRSFGNILEDSSLHMEGDSVPTISNQTSGNLSKEFLDAVQSASFADHASNGLKRSKKIIALQSKALKASKQIAVGQINENVPKSSKVKCKQCQHESNRYEVMMDLTVEVQGSIETLEDALAQFTAPELLDGENKYKCDRCKSYVKAQKWLTVHEAPNILTIALKRFQTGNFGKLNKLVVFPEVLDMSPYMSGAGDKPPLYKLYAVVVHLDMLNASYFGHYVCYVKDLQGVWYKIDDSKVIPVGLDMVMSEGAYMLFYSRSSPRPPAVLKEGIGQNCKIVTVNHFTDETKQSSLLNGHDEKLGVHAMQLMDSCAADTVNGSNPAIVEISDYYANDVDPYNEDNLDAFDFDCNGISSIGRDGNMNLIYRGFEDLASSDVGSLFSGSDEILCSTDSSRDSTSTVDYAETVIGDTRYLPCSSSSVSESCSSSSSMFSMRLPPWPAQTELNFKNDAGFQDSSFSNQHLGKGRIDQGLCSGFNPHSLDTERVPLLSKNTHCLDISPRHRDMLDCRISNTNNYGHLIS